MAEKHSVLVVEVDILARHPLSEYLRECGYRVFEACDIAEAKYILSNIDDIDVVMADTGPNPEASFELARWMRALNSEIKIILAGAVSSIIKHASGLCEDGPEVSKPYDHKLLLQRIQWSLVGKSGQKNRLD